MFRRILSLFLVVLATAGIGVAVKFPALVVGMSAKPISVTIQAKKPTLVCPGPVFVNGGLNGVTLGSFTQAGSVNIVGQNEGAGIALNASGETTLRGSANGSKNLNAIQIQSASQKLASGLAATSCAAGSNSAWLVAGDNTVGREALLVLANPSDVDATVSLQIYGTSGPIQGAGLSGISAPAGKVTVLPLAAFAPKAETLTLHVDSRGAQLGMWIQQKTIRGLSAGGLDLVGESAAPSKEVSIPGIILRDVAVLEKLAFKNADFSDTKPILRVTAAGDKPANFTAQIQGDSSSFGNVIQGSVPAGTTRDFDLEGLDNGNYVSTISSDAPIVAGVRFSRMNGSIPDFTWAQSAKPAKLDAGFTAAPKSKSILSIVNSTAKIAKVSVGGKIYTIESNSNIAIGLTAGRNYSVTSSEPVAMNQVVDVGGGIAVIPVLDYLSVGGKLNVTVR